MATPYQKIYDALLSKILDDEWNEWSEEMAEEDLKTLLEGAIPYFKFPRCSLETNQEGFISDLSQSEIQILATYMKIEWINRTILTWQNLKPLYSEQDFSQANLIDKYTKLLAAEKENAAKLESIYYRSINGKPFPYQKMAGKRYV